MRNNRGVVGTGMRAKMIRAAALKLSQSGLQGTSFAEVLELTGGSRGSIYHHFPGGKSELVAEAVQYVGDLSLSGLRDCEGLPPVEVIKRFSNMWRQVLVGSEMRSGCSVAAVLVGAESRQLIDAVAVVFRSWREELSELLVGGGVSPAEAPLIAASVIASLEGAMILARADRDISVFDDVVQHMVRTALS